MNAAATFIKKSPQAMRSLYLGSLQSRWLCGDPKYRLHIVCGDIFAKAAGTSRRRGGSPVCGKPEYSWKGA